jgi:DNA-binding transcriptional LysR family regulator
VILPEALRLVRTDLPQVLSNGRLIRVLPQCEVPKSDLHVSIQAQRPVPARVRMVADILQKSLPKMLDIMSEADA